MLIVMAVAEKVLRESDTNVQSVMTLISASNVKQQLSMIILSWRSRTPSKPQERSSLS